MAKHSLVWSAVCDRMQTIQTICHAIEFFYDDLDPDNVTTKEEWNDLFVGESDMYHTTFGDAWAGTSMEGWRLFRDHFTELAAQLVDQVGLERFPRQCGDPPVIDPWRRRPDDLAQYLTGADCTLDAGLRVLYWAAVIEIPNARHRSPQHTELVYNWVSNLPEFDSGRCWLSPLPFAWIWEAVVHLANGRVAESQEQHMWSGPKTPKDLEKVLDRHPDRKFTPAELARSWKVKAAKVLTWIRAGDLPAINTAALTSRRPNYRIGLDDIRQFEQRRRVARKTDSAVGSRIRKQKSSNIIQFF